jgi:hypothetical protein
LKPGHIDLSYLLLLILCLLAYSFGLVHIPLEMRLYLVAGSLAVIAFSLFWEHSLRRMFPAATPPSKGYMVHAKQLAQLKAQRSRARKDD